MDVQALLMVEAAPRGYHQHRLFHFQQGLQEEGDVDTDAPTEAEALRRVDITQKVPGREQRRAGLQSQVSAQESRLR